MTQAGGTAPPAKEKYRQISDIVPPDARNGYVFVDVFGEVRKTFDTDIRVELSITDYTENQFLYNQSRNDDQSYDGDQFGYVSAPTRKWPGPWGKMTMDICLWDAHASFARAEVKPGQFVYLRNVHVKFDPNGTKIEGHCRGDRHYPEKINVTIFKPSEAEGNERFKSLLRRKRDYEAKAKAAGLPFDSHVNDTNSNQIKNSLNSNKKRENNCDDGSDQVTDPKAKRNRDRKNRKRAQAKAIESENNPAITTNNVSKAQSLALNTHVRCNNVDIPLTTISSILDLSTLARTTPSGNAYNLPFQNCCYKSKVRVVDYFPDNIADFAAPVRQSEYDILSDQESDDDIDQDTLMRVSSHPSDSPSNETPDVKWEWRFFILVEDARPPPSFIADERNPAQIPLLIAGQDGEYLLKSDACDLRHPSNATELAKLKEKLFVLWGDLAERKEEANSTAERLEVVGGKVKPSARPFECFIKEYGVRKRKQVELTNENEGEDEENYERMFGLCYTSI